MCKGIRYIYIKSIPPRSSRRGTGVPYFVRLPVRSGRLKITKLFDRDFCGDWDIRNIPEGRPLEP